MQLNRLAAVKDNNLTAANITSYTYDNAGNLAGYTYPNGVTTQYHYNTLNRLANMSSSRNTNEIISQYAYTLGPTGNRLNVSELSGRLVNYTYDPTYKLTGETIANDPSSINGSIAYTYNAVGNRLNRTSTVTGIPTSTYAYDVDDRLTYGQLRQQRQHRRFKHQHLYLRLREPPHQRK